MVDEALNTSSAIELQATTSQDPYTTTTCTGTSLPELTPDELPMETNDKHDKGSVTQKNTEKLATC